MARAKPFKLTSPVVLEHPAQRQMADVLRLEIAPPGMISQFGVMWYCIDIASYGGRAPGTRVARGVIAGIPDTFILYCGRAHHLELKTPEGELNDAQKQVCASILAAGGRLGVARDAVDVLHCLDEWGIPRHRRTWL